MPSLIAYAKSKFSHNMAHLRRFRVGFVVVSDLVGNPNDRFSHALAHLPVYFRPMLQCFAELISAAYRDKEIGNHRLIQIFQVSFIAPT